MRKTHYILITAVVLTQLSLNTLKAQEQSSVILTDKAPKPIGPYSQAILKGNTLYVSGQIAINPLSGKLDTTGIENETKQIMENIRAVLESAKMDMSMVVKSTIYLTNLDNFKKVNEVYGNYFKNAPPARETVQVSALPKGAEIEISVIAVK